MVEEKKGQLSKKEVFVKGSIIASIITIPSLVAFGLVWYVSKDLIQAAIIGAVIHFAAMGFSFKISKKFLVKRSSSSGQN